MLRRVPLIDGHNDLPWQFRRLKKSVAEIDLNADTSKLSPPLLTDIPRLRAGCVGAQFWSAYVPATPAGPVAVRAVMEQLDLIHQIAARYPSDFELAFSVADIERVSRKGKIASLIGIEGGHAIDNSLGVLRMMYVLGARYLTLTHLKNNDWADAAGEESDHHGLTSFGELVVREMNRLGMLVDLSHVSDDTMRAALRVTCAPIICSHSSARAVCHHPRNVPDDLLTSVRANGGLVMVCFLPGYLNDETSAHFKLAAAEKTRLERLYPDDAERVGLELENWRAKNPSPPASLTDVADHVEHLREVAGIDHIGIGSDFEGYHGTVVGLEDVSCYPALFSELMGRGYAEGDLEKIAGLNLLRVFREVETVAARLKGAGPSR